MGTRVAHSMRSIAKSAIDRAWRTSAYRAFLFAHDRCSAVGLGAAVKTRPNLILAPGGEGNIGDQAMFDAFLEKVDGPVTAVTFGEDALRVPPQDEDRVEVRPLPRAVRGMPIARWGDVRRFSRLIRSASAFYMPGADTIDGGHVHASLARLSLANIARNASVPVVVQGFSWNSTAPRNVTDALRSLAADALALPRDPVSYRRLVEADCRVTQGADMVFSASTISTPNAELSSFLARDLKTVIINTSGLIHRRVDLRAAYIAAVNELHRRGYRVLFLPHVIRAWDNDLRLAEEIFDASGAADDYLVRQLLSPAEVRHVVSHCSFTLTGRMHLAIMSLLMGTPAATISTVGKVDGLYEMFDLPELVIPLEPISCQQRLQQVIDTLDSDRGRSRAGRLIEEHLPEVQKLALHNFPIQHADLGATFKPST